MCTQDDVLAAIERLQQDVVAAMFTTYYLLLVEIGGTAATLEQAGKMGEELLAALGEDVQERTRGWAGVFQALRHQLRKGREGHSRSPD